MSNSEPSSEHLHQQNPPESDHHISPDPLLYPGSFINSDEGGQALSADQNDDVQPAEPSVSSHDRPVLPDSGDGPPTTIPVVETTPSRLPKRVPEVAAALPERPEWLPEGWGFLQKVRSSGASAGTTDRYYVEPVSGRRFRSKIEVLHFIETGSKLKRKPNPDANVTTSESAVNHKQKKSGTKAKNTPQNFDFENAPEEVCWVLTDASTDIWTPFIHDEKVPESNNRDWDAAFQYLNTRKSNGTMS